MKYDEFRNFRITRTCNKEYKIEIKIESEFG